MRDSNPRLSACEADMAGLSGSIALSPGMRNQGNEILVKKSENRAFLYKGFKLDDSTPCPANCGWRFPAFSGFMDITGNAHGCSVYLSRFTAKSDLVCVTLCCNKGGLDLTELARAVAGCFDARLGPPVDPDVMTCLESCYPVGTTMDRLEATFKSAACRWCNGSTTPLQPRRSAWTCGRRRSSFLATPRSALTSCSPARRPRSISRCA